MILNKPYSNLQYADLAVYCNNNGCYIEDRGDYLEAVKNPQPLPPSLSEQNELIRRQREKCFASEADPLKHDYDEALARGQTELATRLKTQWLAKKDAIRAANPYLPEDIEEQSSLTETAGEQ